MTDLHLERVFDAPPEKLFAFVSSPEGLLQWWGPEGVTIAEHQLDFTTTGPWFSVMVNDKGARMKVSGQVTHVDPPKSVGFTWGWHDETDARNHESHVTITVSPEGAGAKLTLDHRDLRDQEQTDLHSMGWTSSLNKLASVFP